ncbi:MAG: APC family permease [Acidobacteriota bacterium]|jgi:amino acid transporter/nucleotide-binding universal stress UspA family protein|nr:APC family permease [Acidobacteriota bacterium]
MKPLKPTVRKVVVATTVMLSFISFWRAAAIVLCDLGSSAYYAGGIAERSLGESAPWFILGIMLFSYAVRAVYVESCSMFVRGGVYRVVNEALGGTMAKLSVSALLFDFILTGPISGVSAGLYLAGMINEASDLFVAFEFKVNPPLFAAFFAIAATLYFWRKNLVGVHESSQKALRIMQLTTVMVIVLIVWCVVTILQRGYNPVPLPTIDNIRFGEDTAGWLQGSFLTQFTFVAVLIGLGHSVLAMSGEESLAQVNREIASPKLKNLKRAGLVIFVYSLLFTSLVSFFAVMIIPDTDRTGIYIDNLISGLAMNMVGPLPLRLLFHAFVVVVGTLLLSGAVNTAILGSNGVLNRVAEDNVLPDWFREPHKRYGTTGRIITMVVALQIFTILVSRGNIRVLGDVYAFGIVWSFALEGLAVLVLRFKKERQPEWKVPLNIRLGRTEIPVGLGLITLALFLLAFINLFTKQMATVWGLCFALTLFVVFTITERYNRRRGGSSEAEKFRLVTQEMISEETLSVRPGNVLISLSNPHELSHLSRVLGRVDPRKQDVVVMTVKRLYRQGGHRFELDADQIFSDQVALLFSRVVAVAEKAGKHVELLVVPGRDYNRAIVEVAQKLRSNLVVMGLSSKMTAERQAKGFGDAWERLPAPRPQLSLEVLDEKTGRQLYFNLGPHPPRLWPEDIELLHSLWLRLAKLTEPSGSDKAAKLARPVVGYTLHHRDVVRVALRRLDAALKSEHAQEIIDELARESLRDHHDHSEEPGGRFDEDAVTEE